MIAEVAVITASLGAESRVLTRMSKWVCNGWRTTYAANVTFGSSSNCLPWRGAERYVKKHWGEAEREGESERKSERKSERTE